MCLKVPGGEGLWLAFWMLGADFDGSNWPDCGEIDIMEYIGKEPDLIIGTLHGPGYSGALGLTKWSRQKYNIADDYHTYAVEWEPDQVAWFYDREKYFTVTRADVGGRPWVGDRPYFILLNFAAGGTYPFKTNGVRFPYYGVPLKLFTQFRIIKPGCWWIGLR